MKGRLAFTVNEEAVDVLAEDYKTRSKSCAKTSPTGTSMAASWRCGAAQCWPMAGALSCLMLAVECGRTSPPSKGWPRTEGCIRKRVLSPTLTAQCGYCTPAF